MTEVVASDRAQSTPGHAGQSIRRWSLLAPQGTDPTAERIDTLVSSGTWRIERIESHGHSAPTDPDAWFDQDEDEWVMVLTGEGRLRIEGADEELTLHPGDAVWLPAHCRHRVTWTDPDRPTVWIGMFSRPQRAPLS